MPRTPVPPVAAQPARSVLTRTLVDSQYALLAFPLSLLAFLLVVLGLASGLSLLIVWVGVPLLVGTVLLARGFATLERQRLAHLKGFDMPQPDYLTAPAGAGFWARWSTPLRDVQSWLDVLWTGLVALVTGTFAFSVALAWWATALGGATYWFWQRWLPDSDTSLAELIGLGTGRTPEIWLNTAFGVFAVLTLPWAARFAAGAHAAPARALLATRAGLQAQVRHAVGARAASQEAEVAALRRLERDLHDGPQQQLVRLGMDLGRARRQLEEDPEKARAILDEAVAQTRETVEDLRSLSRGIAPPLLVDRGLAVALAEMVARQPAPVDLVVELPEPLGPALETAVYFTVSEALTNVAKHAHAATVQVQVVDRGDQVSVLVRDDGVGGAHPGKGSGLVGLQQRVAAVDGVLSVVSPSGGPTEVRAEIPAAP